MSDFNHLWSQGASARCETVKNHALEGRWAYIDSGKNGGEDDDPIDVNFENFYYFESFTALLFARQYLTENGYRFEEFIDLWRAEDIDSKEYHLVIMADTPPLFKEACKCKTCRTIAKKNLK